MSNSELAAVLLPRNSNPAPEPLALKDEVTKPDGPLS